MAGRAVVLGFPVLCYGAADRYLGLAQAAAGDLDGAEQSLRRALVVNEALEARTWHAWTSQNLASVLSARGEEAASAELIMRTREAADGLGMVALSTRLAR